MNIINELGARDVDQRELDILLRGYFPWCITKHGSSEISYARADHTVLCLKFKKCKHQIELVSIETEPAINESEIEEIRSKIMGDITTPGPRKFSTTVMFSSVATNGWFRFRDEFQLIPVPAGSPQPDQMIADHPLLFEVSFVSSENMRISSSRCGKRLKEIELVCAALLSPSIKQNPSGHCWVWGPHDTDTNNPTSSFRQEGYLCPNIREGINDEFASVADIPPMRIVDFQKFYAGHFGMEDGFIIPDTLPQSLERYEGLSADNKERFLRASYWMQYACKARSLSQSSAFIALVSAIESLFQPAPKRPVWRKCFRPTEPGPTARFRDFLETYLPNSSVSKTTKKEFYRVRSKLAHGNWLLFDDQFSRQINIIDSVLSSDEDRLLWQLSDLVRIAIYNWLHASHAMEPPS